MCIKPSQKKTNVTAIPARKEIHPLIRFQNLNPKQQIQKVSTLGATERVFAHVQQSEASFALQQSSQAFENKDGRKIRFTI